MFILYTYWGAHSCTIWRPDSLCVLGCALMNDMEVRSAMDAFLCDCPLHCLAGQKALDPLVSPARVIGTCT